MIESVSSICGHQIKFKMLNVEGVGSLPFDTRMSAEFTDDLKVSFKIKKLL